MLFLHILQTVSSPTSMIQVPRWLALFLASRLWTHQTAKRRFEASCATKTTLNPPGRSIERATFVDVIPMSEEAVPQYASHRDEPTCSRCSIKAALHSSRLNSSGQPHSRYIPFNFQDLNQCHSQTDSFFGKRRPNLPLLSRDSPRGTISSDECHDQL